MKAEERKEGTVAILPMLNQGTGRERKRREGREKIRRNIRAEGGRGTETIQLEEDEAARPAWSCKGLGGLSAVLRWSGWLHFWGGA